MSQEAFYLFDHQVPQAMACLVVPSPFEVHYRLGYPSLFVLKKLHPKVRSLSSLNCDSCRFESVHFDIWGLCPIVSQTCFSYFVTFVDDHSWLYLMKNCYELLSHFCAFHTEIKK